MKKKVLTVHPTYYCNFDCFFCHQKNHEKESFLSIEKLKEVLPNVPKDLTMIYLMGGEVSVLPDKYLTELLALLEEFNLPIHIQTNLFKVNPILLKYKLVVSYDFESRPRHDTVLKNIMLLEVPYSITTVANRSLLNKGAKNLVYFYSMLGNLQGVKFLPYKVEDLNDKEFITVNEFADFISEMLALKPKFRISQIDSDSERGEDIIITPTGQIEPDSCVPHPKSKCLQCDMFEKCDIRSLGVQLEDDCRYKQFLKG